MTKWLLQTPKAAGSQEQNNQKCTYLTKASIKEAVVEPFNWTAVYHLPLF
ncbi:MAG: hypothetical protein GY739_03915 [Mesoflavibacter sp.]|nr:hypothetical protein [Mesoflavibacter sp.]